MDLSTLESTPLPATLKGLPACAEGRPLNALGALGLSLLDGDLPLPVAVLRQSAMQHNAAWMKGFVERAGVSLCPHGKTTMAPQLFALQLEHGAWGITAATAAQVRIYRHFGVQRVVLANQLLGQANLDLVFDALQTDPTFDFYCLVDSSASLAALQAAVLARRRSHGLTRPLQVLLEVGTAGGRTGVRSMADGAALGRLLRDAADTVALRGVEAFEGVFSGEDIARTELGALAMIDTVAELAQLGCAEQWFAPGEVILSAGGSAFFDLAARSLAAVRAGASGRTLRAVLRSGCYISHDSLHYERMQDRMRQRAGALWGSGPGLRNALEVWAHVQSVPEPGRAICTAGKRDLSYDMGLPQPLWWYRPGVHSAPQVAPQTLRVTVLNDHHAFVDATDGASPLQVGDLVAFGIGHPCTTFDKWPLLYLVDDDYRVVSGLRTFF